MEYYVVFQFRRFIYMKHMLARQFRKPGGVIGFLIARLMIQGNRSAYNTVIEMMDLKGDEKIFEIGYGMGDGVRKILYSTGCTVNGIDFSPLMHSLAVKRNRKYIRSKRASLAFGDFCEIVPGKTKYDRVFFVNVIYFWEDIRKPFRKIHGMLKKGGWICFYMADKDDLAKMGITSSDVFNKHSFAEVNKALTAAGFTDIKDRHKKIGAFRGHFVTARK